MRLQADNKGPLLRPFLSRAPLVRQRSCNCGEAGGKTVGCEECSETKLSLRRSTESAGQTQNSAGLPPIVSEVLRSSGQLLDPATRTFMEPRFGHDFSRVRVHSDSHEAESARAIGAVAYTMGQDIVIPPGQYQPETKGGRQLLAHELTHVIQQSDDRPQGDPVDAGGTTILKSAALQQEADNLAQGVTDSAPPGAAAVPSAVRGSAPLSIQLQDDPKKAPDAGEQAEKTPLEQATALVEESPASLKERAIWILKAADQGFVTFNTTKARENVESVRDEKQVEKLDPKAADYDVPILEVEVVLAKQVAKRWVDAKGIGDKGSIQFGSMIRSGADPHGKGKAIDINNLKMITSVDATIVVLNDLDKDVHSSYGLGMPFQGDFFDPADNLETKKLAAEGSTAPVATPESGTGATPPASSEAGAKPTEKEETPTKTVTDGVKKFTSHIYQSTGTKGADNKWTWKDSIQEAGAAYKRLKSQTLKDALASRRKGGFSFVIFPDNDNHLHLDVR